MNNSKSGKGYQLRSGLFVLPEQEKTFVRLVTELQRSLPARFVMLADAAGQVIAARGAYNDANLVMLGSLAAGDLAASQEIARLTGEYQDYQIILREGQRSNIFIAEAGSHLILLAQAGKETPLGWARMFILKTARQLAEAARQGAPSAQEIAEMEEELAGSLSEEDEQNLAELFGNALDGLWSE